MKAPMSKKARRLLRKKGVTASELVKEILIGSKNGIDTKEGHEFNLQTGEKINIKKIGTFTVNEQGKDE